MKKSKFLKKSLAMLLAVMLVVAMIPLSAAAADTPAVSYVTVNGASTEVNGNTYSATIKELGSNDSVEVIVELLNGNGQVQYQDKVATEENGVFTFTLSDEDEAAGRAEFDVYTDDSNDLVDTYTVTFDTTPQSGNNSVESVAYEGMYATRTSGNNFTATYAYGDGLHGTVTVTLEDATATVTAPNGSAATDKGNGVWEFNAGGNDTMTFNVTSENGVTARYNLNLVPAAAFDTFSVEGERLAADIGRVTEGQNGATVTVHMPYDTKADANGNFYFTPSFTTSFESLEVYAEKPDHTHVAFESGTEYNLKDLVVLSNNQNLDGVDVTLVVTYSEEVSETWTLSFEVPAEDPVAAITGLTIQNYQATVEGTTITIALPEVYRTTNGTVEVATNNDILVTNGTTVNSVNGIATLRGIDLTKDRYTLRATAKAVEIGATSKDVQDYTLIIETAEVEEAQMTNMTLRDPDGKDYTGVIDQEKGTITFSGESAIPYSVRSRSDLSGWKLFWTASSGATVTTSQGAMLPITGSDVDVDAGYLPNGDRFDNTAAEATIIVEAPNYSAKNYTIVFDSADPSTDSTLSNVELTYASTWNTKNTSNSLPVEIGKDANGVNTLTVDVPYKDWEANNYNSAWVSTVLPANSELYFVNRSGQLDATNVLNATSAVTNEDVLPQAYTGNNVYGYGQAWNETAPDDTLTMIVISEALADTINDGANFNTILNNNSNLGKYTVYELTLVEQAPRQTAEITAFSVYNDYDGTTATGTVNGDDITITLPYYYDYTKAAGKADLYVDFDVKGGETVTVENSALVSKGITPLTFNQDGTVSSTSTPVIANQASSVIWVQQSYTVGTIRATSEDGDTTNDYTLTVKFAEPENGALLNSVTINGVTVRPDANHNVNITMPLGTEITSLVPTFDLSENAYVTYDGNEIDPGYAFNFVSDKTIEVTSESGTAHNTYRIHVEVSNRFTDVNEGDWFFEDVMAGVENGYIQGVGNGRFDPYGDITRAQFACLIARAMGFEEPAEGTEVDTRFIDVPSDYWGAAAIAFCQQGLIEGYSNGEFRPQNYITRQEVATILARAFDLTEISDEKYVDDNLIPEWSSDAIYMNKAAGIMNGDAAGTFRPAANMNRAEAATVLMNANRAGLIE